MPIGTVTIDTEKRNGIYELVRNHLAGLSDVFMAMERRGDFIAAERLGHEFSEDFRLLQDIGWRPQDYRRRFVLTMPVPELTAVLLRLRGEAEHLLCGARRDAIEQETGARIRLGYHVCEELLVDLDRPEEEP